MRYLQLGLLVLLLAVAGLLTVRGVRKVARGRSATAVCDAVNAGDWEEAIRLGERVQGVDDHARGAAECCCVAYLETGRRAECVDSLERLMADRDTGDWLPSPVLAAVTIEARRDRGDLPGAADLAKRAALANPQDPLLPLLELQLRSRVEDEGEVLAELSERLAGMGDAGIRLREAIVEARLKRKEWDEALAELGTEPPTDEDLSFDWYKARATALAGLGRTGEVREEFQRWRQAGGDPAEIDAGYALLLSTYQLQDGRTPTLELLKEAVDGRARLEDEVLRRYLFWRLVGALVVEGHFEEALAYYDLGVAEHGELKGLERQDLLRSRTQSLMEKGGVHTDVGTVEMVFAGPLAGDELLVTPAAPADVDAEWDSVPVPASGRVVLERKVGVAPERWVLRDNLGRPRASGVFWPVPGQRIRVDAERGLPREPERFRASRRPADGRRRIVVAILDCGDWRLIQFGRHRGELPVLDHLYRTGFRGVLDSDPPYTAVAIEAVARPHRRGVSSFLGFLHSLGSEAEALNFVGVNPFDPLGWLLPEDDDIFTTLGRTQVVAANMLKSFGPLQVGRQSMIHGPDGAERRASGFQGSRPLSEEELGRLPGLEAESRPEDMRQLEEMAADFDTLAAFAAGGEVDLTVLRVASLDILTHSNFAPEVRSGSAGGGLLRQVYRYVDSRLGELYGVLDEDDLLVVMSDHGIRTALEHDRGCLFLVTGGAIPALRIEGRPEIRGTGRFLADALGVETDWPATGIEVVARYGLP